MLEVRDLTVRYGTLCVADSVSFSVQPGEWLMIAGPNGAGKTTFAREFLPREAACPDFIWRQLDTL